MLVREYRICMPLSVDEYQIGQLFMIAKHSAEQSHEGEGVEVVENCPHEDPEHGKGQYTEKRIYLSSRLPSWLKPFIPRIFYITEKAWNYYPYTLTEYQCSFLPRLSVNIKTRYENNNGSTENCLNLSQETLTELTVEHIDILEDELSEKHYKESEDLVNFKSVKTGRGPLHPGWRDTFTPIMCSYKAVEVKLDIWGIQSRLEDYVQRTVREILLLAHRQAFAWIDEWYGMTIDEVREYELKMQCETNSRLNAEREEAVIEAGISARVTPTTPCPPSGDGKKGWIW